MPYKTDKERDKERDKFLDRHSPKTKKRFMANPWLENFLQSLTQEWLSNLENNSNIQSTVKPNNPTPIIDSDSIIDIYSDSNSSGIFDLFADINKEENSEEDKKSKDKKSKDKKPKEDESSESDGIGGLFD